MFYSATVVLFSALLAQTLGQSLVLLGGNLRDDNTVVWKKIVDLAGGSGVAKFCVVSASIKSPPESDKVVANLLSNGAASATAVPLVKASVANKVVNATINACSGIFIVEDTNTLPPKAATTVADSFTSFIFQKTFFVPPLPAAESNVVAADPATYKRLSLIDILRPKGADSGLLKSIKAIANSKVNGVVVGNAAIMGRGPMILDGDSVSALVLGSKNFYSYPRTPVTYSKLGGLGFLSTPPVIESRLSEAGREVRLMRVLLESGNTLGLGVDENTALVITALLTKPIATVVTAANATTGVLTMSVAGISTSSMYTANYKNILFNFFSADDTLDLTTGVVTYPAWKTALAGNEAGNATQFRDILSLVKPGQWRVAAANIIQQDDEDTIASLSQGSLMPLMPTVWVVFNRTDSVGYATNTTTTGNVTGVSFSNMKASIIVEPIYLPLIEQGPLVDFL